MLRPMLEISAVEECSTGEKTYFPSHEADCLNNRGLNNLLAREHAPCHGVRAIRMGVRS